MFQHKMVPLEVKIEFVSLLDGPDFKSAVEADAEIWRFVINDDALSKKYRRAVVAKKVIESALVASFGSTAYLKVDEIVRDGYSKVCAVGSRIAKEVDEGEWDWPAIYDVYKEGMKRTFPIDKSRFRKRTDVADLAEALGFERFLSERDEEEVDAYDELMRDDLGAFLPIRVPKPFPEGNLKKGAEELVYEYRNHKVNMLMLKAALDGVF